MLSFSITLVNVFSTISKRDNTKILSTSASFDSALTPESNSYKNNTSFVILNESGFKNFAQSVTNGCSFSGKEVILQKNLDLNNQSMNPIGAGASSLSGQFGGKFTGNGKVISNVKITNSSTYFSVGLFACVSGTVENLFINGITVDIGVKSSSNSNAYIGGSLCGVMYSSAKIKNVRVDKAKITIGNGILYSSEVGGFVGYIESSSNVRIENCNLNGFKFESSATTYEPTHSFKVAEFGPAAIESGSSATLDQCEHTLHHKGFNCSNYCTTNSHYNITGTVSADHDHNYTGLDIVMNNVWNKVGKSCSGTTSNGSATYYNTFSSQWSTYIKYYKASNFNFGSPVLMNVGWLTPEYFYYSHTTNGTLNFSDTNAFSNNEIDSGGDIAVYYSVYLPSDDTTSNLDYTKKGDSGNNKWIADFIITPVPNSGYKFKEWIEDTTTVSGKTIYVATFETDGSGGGGGDTGGDDGSEDPEEPEPEVPAGDIVLTVILKYPYYPQKIFETRYFTISNGSTVKVYQWKVYINDKLSFEAGWRGKDGYTYIPNKYIFSVDNIERSKDNSDEIQLTTNTTLTINYRQYSCNLTYKNVDHAQLFYNGDLWLVDKTYPKNVYSENFYYEYTQSNPDFENKATWTFTYTADRIIVYALDPGYKISKVKINDIEHVLNSTHFSIGGPSVIEPIVELGQCTVTIAELGDYADMATLTISTPGEEDVSTTEPFAVEMGTIINFSASMDENGIFTYTYVFVYNETTIKTATYVMSDALYVMQFKLDENEQREKLLNSLNGTGYVEQYTINGITTLTISPTFGLRQYLGGLG